VRRKETTSLSAYGVLTTNTSFLSALDRLPDKFSVATQLEQIARIETEISVYHSLESPDLSARYQCISDPPSISGIRMRDLMFKRLEELVTALKKRSLIFDDSDDLILHVTANYGNIASLLERYESVKAENERLRAEERVFKDDSLSKRRMLSVVAPSQLAKLAFLLQQELDMQHSVGRAMTHALALDSSRLDFDDICQPGNASLNFVGTEFPTTADPETVAKISSTESRAERLSLLRALVREQSDTNQKMSDAITSLRSHDDSSSLDSVNEREQRLWELHGKFSSQLIDLQQRIDERYAEIDVIHTELLDALCGNGASDRFTGTVYHRLSALADAHVSATALLAQNRASASHLADVTFLFGLGLLRANDASLEAHLRCAAALTSRPPSERSLAILPPPRSDDDVPHAPRFLRMSLGGKRRKRGGHLKELSGGGSQMWAPNPIEAAAPSQMLDFVALTHRLRAQARAETESRYHTVISEALRETLAQAFADMGALFNAFQKEMDDGITLTGLGSTEVLRRPKAEIATQAGQKEIEDVASLTEVADPKGRGRRRGRTPQRNVARRN
jgi:hypothetical protein